MTPLDKITQQLNTVKTLAGIVFGPPDGHLDKFMTDRLAAYLVSVGCQDVRDITDLQASAAAIGVDVGQLELVINLRTGDTVAFDAVTFDDSDIRWRVRPQFTRDGFPIFLWQGAPVETGGFISGFLQAMAPIAPIASLVLAFAIPGLGATLGQFILGPTLSAAVPALTTVVGNAALNTALNGGDIISGVKGSLLSFAGGNIGGAVSSGLQGTAGDLVATAAGRATAAFITGGDPRMAVAGVLAQQGASSMWDFFDEGSSTSTPDYQAIDSFDPTVIDVGSIDSGALNMDASYDTSAGFSDAAYSADQSIDYSGGVYTMTDPSQDYQAPVPDIAGITDVQPGTYSIPDETPTSASGELVFDDVSGSVGSTPTANGTPSGGDWSSALSNLALGALKVYTTWKNTGRQTISTPGVSTTANGSIVAPRKDGMLVTTTPAGRVSTGRMPVGKPYLFADGSLVTNNGDGTYTTIGANGTTQTLSYPAASGLSSLFGSTGDNRPLIYAGLGLGALLLLSRRA